MHGKNAVASKMQDPDGMLLVHDIWYTLQGEGPDAGRTAVFVRLSKCNLRCYFCDTDFDGGKIFTADQAFAHIMKMIRRGVCDLVVITGGEPLLHNIIPLVSMLNSQVVSVAVETAGTVWCPGIDKYFSPDRSIGGNIIVCSPKTPIINGMLEPFIGAWKYIVRNGECDGEDGLPVFSTQIPGQMSRVARPRNLRRATPIYVQAQDEGEGKEFETQANLEYAAGLAMTHGHRLSVQTHKLARVP